MTDGACQYFGFASGSAAWNMALDEAMLEHVPADGIWLRFYTWQLASISLGYFQRYADCHQLHSAAKIDVVRRLSGGGALIHDLDVTYALAVVPASGFAATPLSLYQAVHSSLVAALAEWHLVARLVDESPRQTDDPPFLCFERRGQGDVLLDDETRSTASPIKVAGSAQRKRRGSILQHGSVLLGASPAANHIPGIAEASGVVIRAGDLVETWRLGLGNFLGCIDVPTPLPPAVHATASQLALRKYSSGNWLRRR